MGVFLGLQGRLYHRFRLPHVRGGVSAARGGYTVDAVFPTCVGVFGRCNGHGAVPGSLPHVRGGVSNKRTKKMTTIKSSPRAWGCFSLHQRKTSYLSVFPTCVGVFLTMTRALSASVCLPHVRGGVSTGQVEDTAVDESSPRAWGCFSSLERTRTKRPVFPTCVGVFPPSLFLRRTRRCLPHVRGGVSGAYNIARKGTLSSPHTWGVRQIREVRVQSFCAHTRKIPCEGNLHRGSIFTGCGERI